MLVELNVMVFFCFDGMFIFGIMMFEEFLLLIMRNFLYYYVFMYYFKFV